jgi:hypothetical protein
MPGGGEEVLGSLPSLENIEAYVDGGGTAEPLGTLPTLDDIEAYVSGGGEGVLGTLPTVDDIQRITFFAPDRPVENGTVFIRPEAETDEPADPA